jgi:uncharacterized membrane protein
MITTIFLYYAIACLLAIVLAFIIKGRTHVKSIWRYARSVIILALLVGVVGWAVQALTSIELNVSQSFFVQVLVVAGGIFIFLLGIEIGNLLEKKFRG